LEGTQYTLGRGKGIEAPRRKAHTTQEVESAVDMQNSKEQIAVAGFTVIGYRDSMNVNVVKHMVSSNGNLLMATYTDLENEKGIIEPREYWYHPRPINHQRLGTQS
jgi:hypothetical protein